MAKFYVTLSHTQLIVQALDAEGAALWGIHQILDNDQDDAILISDSSSESLFVELGEIVQVSEQGFGRCEAGCFATTDVLQKYLELMTALDGLVESL